MASKDLQGRIIDDSYRILSSLGEGGVGEVYLAWQIALERKVAIKFLHDYLVDDAEWQERFRREGRILATLLHPNIVKCFAYGFWQNKLPYLVFEYIDGATLRSLISSKAALPWRQVFKLSLQICSALAYAHEAGVVHRDLKPDNIIVSGLDDSAQAKVLDFGLARIFDSAGPPAKTLTGTGQIVGTANYMSPEQCLGKKPSAGSDIYSLGCIMYEAICGKLPLDDDSAAGVIYKQINEYPELASSHIIGLPKAVDTVLLKCMAKSPEQRYETAGKMAEELARVLQSDSEHGLTALVIPVSDELSAQLSNRSKRSLKNWTVAVLVLLVLSGGLACLSLSDPGSSVLIELYAGLLAKNARTSFLESRADFVMKNMRMKAAERLLDKALQECDTQDTISAARLLAKLAYCSFFLQQRNEAINRATECLVLSCLNGCRRDIVDSPVILQAASVIERLEAPCAPRLERALRYIMTESAFANSYEVVIHANLALQSTSMPNRDAAASRVCLLIEGLRLAQKHADKAAIKHLLEHARKQDLRLVSCRSSFQYFLDSVENEIDKNGTALSSPDLLARHFIQTLCSDKAGSAMDRTGFAYYLFGLKIESDYFCGPSADLQNLVSSGEDPILCSYAAMLAARFCLLEHDYRQGQEMLRQSILLSRSIAAYDIESRKHIFNGQRLIAKFPRAYAGKTDLARLIYAEAKAQGVPLSAETILAIVEGLTGEKTRSPGLQKEIKALLYEAGQKHRERNKMDAFYLEALIQCIKSLRQAGETALYETAMQILSEDAKKAREMDLIAYYDFMAAQAKSSRPEKAAGFAAQARRIRMERMDLVLSSDTGKAKRQ